jgi:hypothetical protein
VKPQYKKIENTGKGPGASYKMRYIGQYRKPRIHAIRRDKGFLDTDEDMREHNIRYRSNGRRHRVRMDVADFYGISHKYYERSWKTGTKYPKQWMTRRDGPPTYDDKVWCYRAWLLWYENM